VKPADRLEARLRALRASGRKGVVPYVTAGDGGSDVTLAILRELADLEVPCVALGLPFSEPIADGPVLQAANDRALASGMSFEELLEILVRLRRGGRGEMGRDVPIVVMSYARPLVRRGWEQATRALARAGADGLVVADLPIADAGPLLASARACGLAPIFFVAPTSSESQLGSAVRASRGFVYAIGRLGAAGGARELDLHVRGFLARVRAAAGGLSLVVGFGISNAAEAEAVLAHADLALVGGAFVEHVHRAVLDAEPSRRTVTARAATREFLQILGQLCD
jgi:tryptophan synthase alpha chain